MIFACASEQKVDKKDGFNNELSISWDKYLINIKKIIKASEDKKVLIKIKNDMTTLYFEGREEYSNFPDDIAIRVSRLSEEIDEKIRPKFIRNKNYFKTIDIVSQKITENNFFGELDDGTNTIFTEKDLKGSFYWPLNKLNVTSSYGFRTDPFSKETIGFHHGIDLSGTSDDYVFSSNYGKVVFAGKNGGYGLMVIISHAKGISSVYGHLSKISVEKGMFVKRGEAIGKVGSTGKSTGPHLHFEIRKDNRSLDPAFFIESQGVK